MCKQDEDNGYRKKNKEGSLLAVDLLACKRTPAGKNSGTPMSKSGIKRSPIDPDALKKAVEAVILQEIKSQSEKPALVYDGKYISNMIVSFYGYIFYLYSMYSNLQECMFQDMYLKGGLKKCCNVCKMVDNDGSFRQRAVIKFLVEEEKSAAEIHLRLQHAYADVCKGASSVRRWVKHFEDGNTSIQDEPRSGALELPPRNATRKELMSSGMRFG
ncbi:hypothetical protein ANN_21823 [Periplaneta americana]|uniref:Mos1 transposase HTH domain-containing protein n=1 Tax=Periplaneta americana TaxID=6978 RepID=A0ABQ8S7G4_PERAM|nr:hypothetical protein ANN_21823 [Periplaneta americana]